MKLLRSVFAIVAGYATLAIIVIVATLVAVKLLLPSANSGPTPPYLVINLIYSAVAAALGGYVAAFVARRAPMIHAGLLAVLFVGLSVATGFEAAAGQPRWYPMVIASLGVPLPADGLRKTHGMTPHGESSCSAARGWR